VLDCDFAQVNLAEEFNGNPADVFMRACESLYNAYYEYMPQTFQPWEGAGNSLSSILDYVVDELAKKQYPTTVIFRNLEYASGKKRELLPSKERFSIRKALRMAMGNITKQEKDLHELLEYLSNNRELIPCRVVLATSDIQLLPAHWWSEMDNHDSISRLHFWKQHPFTKEEVKALLPIQAHKISLYGDFIKQSILLEQVWEYTQGHPESVYAVVDQLHSKSVEESIDKHQHKCYKYFLQVVENFVILWYDATALNHILAELCENNFRLLNTPIGTPRSKEVEYLVACDILFQNVDCLEVPVVPMQKAISHFMKTGQKQEAL